MERRQGGCDAENGRKEPGAKFVDAEQFIAGHHRPKHQRGFFGKHLAVEPRHDPIAAPEHLAGTGAVQGLVHVPQPGPAEVGEKNHGSRCHDPKLITHGWGHFVGLSRRVGRMVGQAVPDVYRKVSGTA